MQYCLQNQAMSAKSAGVGVGKLTGYKMLVPQSEPVVLTALQPSQGGRREWDFQHKGEMAAALAPHHRLAERVACCAAQLLSTNQW